MECLKGCLLFCIGLSAGPELEPFMMVGPEWEKKGKIKRRTPLSPNTLFFLFFVLSCLSLSLCIYLFLLCLTHIASLHSSLTVALFVSNILLLKPLALCHSAGLMLNWTRHYPSLSNTHKHTPSLLSSSSLVLAPLCSFFFSLLANLFTEVGRKGSDWKSVIQTLQALHAQTGRPIFLQQIPGMP